MNHKEYKAPAMDVVKLEMADVIVTSNGDPTGRATGNGHNSQSFSLFYKLRSGLDKGEMSDPFK